MSLPNVPSDLHLAFGDGPGGKTFEGILQHRINYQASRSLKALRMILADTDRNVQKWKQALLKKEIVSMIYRTY